MVIKCSKCGINTKPGEFFFCGLGRFDVDTCSSSFLMEEQFVAGEGRKDDTAKLQYHLIPPEALEEVTKVLMFGAEKYGPRNWEKGMAWSRLFDASLRHLIKWFSGEDRDEESGLHHLSHVLCNIMFLVAYVRRSAGTDDRPRVP